MQGHQDLDAEHPEGDVHKNNATYITLRDALRPRPSRERWAEQIATVDVALVEVVAVAMEKVVAEVELAPTMEDPRQ